MYFVINKFTFIVWCSISKNTITNTHTHKTNMMHNNNVVVYLKCSVSKTDMSVSFCNTFSQEDNGAGKKGYEKQDFFTQRVK